MNKYWAVLNSYNSDNLICHKLYETGSSASFLCSLLLLYLPMAPRCGPISQSVTIELEDVKLTTTITSETNVHHVECDFCGEDIALTQSANPYRIKSHQAACKARIAKAAAKKVSFLLVLEILYSLFL